MNNHQEALTVYTAAFVDELTRLDVRHAVISPGSRSTPISMLLAGHPAIDVHINIDERSAAFFALGIAKATQEPVVLVCTSGTAAANYYPAIVEAKLSRVPLIVITADRPHELRDVGAPQTIDQIHLYASHVKWFSEMAIPSIDIGSIQYVRNVSRRAVIESRRNPAGPVHLNFPVREPLIPNMKETYYHAGRNEQVTFQLHKKSGLTVRDEEIQSLVFQLEGKKKGILVCGELHNDEFVPAIVQLAEQLQFPILADPLSQIRTASNHPLIIDCYDTFLRNEKAVKTLEPEVIIRFGAMPVSKALTLFIKQNKDISHIVVDGAAGWREPTGLATQFVDSDEVFFCRKLATAVKVQEETIWREQWQQLNKTAKTGLQAILSEQTLNEGKVFSLLEKVTPNDSYIFVSNSMPIRDCDTFLHCNESNRKIFANRGANGIDGVISTALGVSIVGYPTVLVIGDLSFYHDLNALLAAKKDHLNITIILVNNDGGGIFSFLPQAAEKNHFEELFGTPHGLDFSHVVKMYNGQFNRVTDWEQFNEAVTESFKVNGLKVIEVVTNREENVQYHRNLQKNVSQEINFVLAGE